MLYCASCVSVCYLISSEAHLLLVQGSSVVPWKSRVNLNIWWHYSSYFYFLESFFSSSELLCLCTLLSFLLLYMDFPLNLLLVFDIFWMSMKNVFSSWQLLLFESKPSCHHYMFLLKSHTFLYVLTLSFFLVGRVIYKEHFVIINCSSVWSTEQTVFEIILPIILHWNSTSLL